MNEQEVKEKSQQVAEAQLEALAALRQRCQDKVPDASINGALVLAQSLQIIGDQERAALEKLRVLSIGAAASPESFVI